MQISRNPIKAKAFERFYALSAFDNMELSTQALLFDAIQKGLKIEILDERDQFLSLQFGDHLEYVENGNMTSHDSYILLHPSWKIKW